MNITGTKGLTTTTIASLKALGAIAPRIHLEPQGAISSPGKIERDIQ